MLETLHPPESLPATHPFGSLRFSAKPFPPDAGALKDRRCHVPKRQLFKGPLGDLQQTTLGLGLDNDGGDDADASDAFSCLKAPLPNLPPPFFE